MNSYLFKSQILAIISQTVKLLYKLIFKMTSRMGEVVHCNPPENGNDDSVNKVYAGLFKKSLKKLEEYALGFDEILDIVKRNSVEEGDIWAIGSFVYRGIVEELYGPLSKKSPLDIDFLVERHTSKVDRPRGWDIERTSYGDIAFMRHDGRCKVDISSLFNLHGIESRKLPPNIRHFYTATPLNVQSITYNCGNGEILGGRGIEAIERKVIKVNNLNELKWEAGRLSRLTYSHVTPNNLVKAKAEELEFGYELPESPKFLPHKN